MAQYPECYSNILPGFIKSHIQTIQQAPDIDTACILLAMTHEAFDKMAPGLLKLLKKVSLMLWQTLLCRKSTDNACDTPKAFCRFI